MVGVTERPRVAVQAPARGLRRFCRGTPPLDARLEGWQRALLGAPGALDRLVERCGSPLNLLRVPPFERNVERLLEVGRSASVPLQVFFARKANKALAFVDAAQRRGWGVDVASFEELRQGLERRVEPARLIVTAAVKSADLLELAATRGVTVALDNADEARALARAARRAREAGERLPVAARLSGFHHRGTKLFSRFGFDVDTAAEAIRELWREDEIRSALRLEGLHFHLGGYRADERIAGLRACLDLADALGPEGRALRFLDMGGGFPMRYLDDAAQWRRFWRHLERALRGEIPPLTYRNHGLGIRYHAGERVSEPRVYPFYQEPVAADWLRQVLRAPAPGHGVSIAAALRRRRLALYCEPGRCLLDGCGMTVARVAWVKDHPEGHRLAGLVMNRTQCRTGSLDFLVDPLLVPASGRSRPGAAGRDVATYLTGAYCIEDELLSWRALRFPHGIQAGDLVAWPNTAGYFMHFLESRSHQLPLARNLVVTDLERLGDPEAIGRLDAIDTLENPAGSGLRAPGAAAGRRSRATAR